MSGDDSVFESIYCNTCNDTLVDPFFGDPCLDCQSEPIERKERLLQLFFANKSLFGQMIAVIEANSVTTDELKNQFSFIKSELSNISLLRNPKTGWRGFVDYALRKTGPVVPAQKTELEILNDAIRQVILIREQVKRRGFEERKHKVLSAIELQKFRVLQQEHEKVRNAERVQFMLEKCRVSPLVEFPGWYETWKCKCFDCGAEVFPRFSVVRKSSWACIPCARRRFNEMRAESQHDERARLMEDVGGVIPVDPYKGSKEPWRSKCKTCKSIITPRFDDVVNRGKGACSVCFPPQRRFSFNSQAPGIIYFLEHLDLRAFKVGVTTTAAKTDRIAQHEYYGWTKLRTWPVESGFIARNIEQKILGCWRNERYLPHGCNDWDMPQGGFTETIPMLNLLYEEEIQRIERIIEEQGNELFPRGILPQKFSE